MAVRERRLYGCVGTGAVDGGKTADAGESGSGLGGAGSVVAGADPAVALVLEDVEGCDWAIAGGVTSRVSEVCASSTGSMCV